MRVVATMVGYDGLAVRQVGEEFDMPHSQSSWFKPVEVEDLTPDTTEVSQEPVVEVQEQPRRGRPPKSK